MSTVVEQPAPAAPPSALARGSLLRAEALRFRSRRFIQVLAVLALVAWAAATVIGLLSFSSPTDADYAAARAQVEQMVAEQRVFWEECLESEIPEGEPVENWCGPEPTVENWGGVESFLDRQPFVLADSGTSGALGVAALSAAFAFVLGGTWIGAEWSTRSIVALLFWVPQRLKVIGVKLGVLVVATALFGVLAQAAWLGTAWLLDTMAGTDEPIPAGFWSDLLQTQARGVLLVVLAGLLGFGLVNIMRNTGAALGVAFVYVAIVENLIRVMRPYWDPHLLTTSAAALVQDGGLTIQIWDDTRIDADGMQMPVEYYVGHLQAGLTLAFVAAVVVGAGTWLFAKRDLH